MGGLMDFHLTTPSVLNLRTHSGQAGEAKQPRCPFKASQYHTKLVSRSSICILSVLVKLFLKFEGWSWRFCQPGVGSDWSRLVVSICRNGSHIGPVHLSVALGRVPHVG
jgi:hypothetical protein